MGRSLAILVAMLVVFSGAAALVTSAGTASAASAVTLEIIAPQNEEQVQTPYVMLRWTVSDPDGVVGKYHVIIDHDLSNPRVTTSQEMNLTDLSEGLHSVLVRAYTESGVGTDAQDSVSFSIDTSAPTLKIISPASNSWLNTSSVTVSWQASSVQGISYFDVRMDSEPWISPIPADQLSNTFQGVTNGPHNVTVVAHAWGGKTSTAVVAFNVDTTIPTVSITYPGDGAGFNHGDITVVWSGSDAGNNLAGYQIWVDGVKVTTAIPSENHYNANFADGYHTIRIVAYDIANSTASDEATFLIDTVRPSIVSKGPTGDQEPIGAKVQVEFSKAMRADATNITIDGVAGTMSWDGNTLTFTPSAPLAYGTTYHVTLDATDMVGNTIHENWSFATTDMGIITGVVTDKDGKPLAGVKVALDTGEYVMTNEAGEFTATARAGQHNLTLSKLGWDGKIVTVSLQPGQTISIGSTVMTPTDPLAIFGIIAAVGAVAVVGVLYYFGRRGKKRKRPQTPRSIRSMENLQRRAAQKGRDDLDEDDDDYL
jgi:hypothetical protein